MSQGWGRHLSKRRPGPARQGPVSGRAPTSVRGALSPEHPARLLCAQALLFICSMNARSLGRTCRRPGC